MQDDKVEPLQTLKDIHGIMERSSRFLSLSGWSGVWAGGTALIGAAIAKMWLQQIPSTYRMAYPNNQSFAATEGEYKHILLKLVFLALGVLLVALAGGYYFTKRKAIRDGIPLWNGTSKRMLVELAIPLATGGVFAFAFLWHGLELYIAPICLTFYGMALINGSKYTLSDIKYLGIAEVVLGCICLFIRGYGLVLWTIGFGVLHILYGIIMWKKYDSK
ncbi:MAG: hypothetical protein JNK00_13565 [Flavipsychrobacter sp.]|nr:hypothetical protein [Flavipsychrobacter sp.]